MGPRKSRLNELKTLTNELMMRDEQLHYMKTFMDALPIGVYACYSNCKMYYFNEMAINTFGPGINPNYALEHDNNGMYKMLLPGTDTEFMQKDKLKNEKCSSCENKTARCELIAKALSGKSDSVLMDVCKPEGKVKIRIRSTPILGSDGEVRFALVTFYELKE